MSSLRTLSMGRLSQLIRKQYKPFLAKMPSVKLSRAASSLGGKGDGDDPTNSRRLTFNVNKFGELLIRDVALCNFSVDRVNPELNPDQNTALVELPEGVELKVDCTESSLSLRRQGREDSVSDSPLPLCNIEVPIKYNVDICVDGRSNITVKDLQNERIMVTTESGDCLLSNIQSNGISVATSGGNITSEGLMHSNAILRTQQNGGIILNKFLCQQLDVSTDSGDIDITSLYAVESKFTTDTGSIHIRNAHRNIDVDVRSQGDLIVDSLDGNLSALVNTGDVELFVSRSDGVNIQVESGDISLKLSTSLSAHLDLKGSSVVIDDKIQLFDTIQSSADGIVSISGNFRQERIADPPTIRAHTKEGLVIVEIQSWVDSLKLSISDEKNVA